MPRSLGSSLAADSPGRRAQCARSRPATPRSASRPSWPGPGPWPSFQAGDPRALLREFGVGGRPGRPDRGLRAGFCSPTRSSGGVTWPERRRPRWPSPTVTGIAGSPRPRCCWRPCWPSGRATSRARRPCSRASSRLSRRGRDVPRRSTSRACSARRGASARRPPWRTARCGCWPRRARGRSAPRTGWSALAGSRRARARRSRSCSGWTAPSGCCAAASPRPRPTRPSGSPRRRATRASSCARCGSWPTPRNGWAATTSAAQTLEAAAARAPADRRPGLMLQQGRLLAAGRPARTGSHRVRERRGPRHGGGGRGSRVPARLHARRAGPRRPGGGRVQGGRRRAIRPASAPARRCGALGWLEYVPRRRAGGRRRLAEAHRDPWWPGVPAARALLGRPRAGAGRGPEAAAALYRRVLGEAPRSYYGMLAREAGGARSMRPTRRSACPPIPARRSPTIPASRAPSCCVGSGSSSSRCRSWTTWCCARSAIPCGSTACPAPSPRRRAITWPCEFCAGISPAPPSPATPHCPVASGRCSIPSAGAPRSTRPRERAGLDPFLVAAVVREESSYYPRALSPGRRPRAHAAHARAPPSPWSSSAAWLSATASCSTIPARICSSARHSWPACSRSGKTRAWPWPPTTPDRPAPVSGGGPPVRRHRGLRRADPLRRDPPLRQARHAQLGRVPPDLRTAVASRRGPRRPPPKPPPGLRGPSPRSNPRSVSRLLQPHVLVRRGEVEQRIQADRGLLDPGPTPCRVAGSKIGACMIRSCIRRWI